MYIIYYTYYYTNFRPGVLYLAAQMSQASQTYNKLNNFGKNGKLARSHKQACQTEQVRLTPQVRFCLWSCWSANPTVATSHRLLLPSCLFMYCVSLIHLLLRILNYWSVIGTGTKNFPYFWQHFLHRHQKQEPQVFPSSPKKQSLIWMTSHK